MTEKDFKDTFIQLNTMVYIINSLISETINNSETEEIYRIIFATNFLKDVSKQTRDLYKISFDEFFKPIDSSKYNPEEQKKEIQKMLEKIPEDRREEYNIILDGIKASFVLFNVQSE